MAKKAQKSELPSIVVSLILFIIGLLLLLYSDTIIKMVSIVLGIVLIVAGIVMIVRYFKEENRTLLTGFNFGYGVISMIAGSALILNPTIVGSLLPFVIGIWVIISSIMRLEGVFYLKQTGSDKWVTPLILAIISLICGILCVFGPFLVASIIVQFIGIIVMIYAVVDIINGISVGQAMPSEKNAKTKDKDDIPDALVEEIKPKKKKGKKAKDDEE